MNITETNITKLVITDVKGLDPVGVVLEDLGPRQGKITIDCYGKSWTSYWGGMGQKNIAEFYCSCDEHYLAKNLSNIDSTIYDIDALRKLAEEKGVECWRDDPWNDHDFMTEMFGSDPYDWHDSIPTMQNPDYYYLCKIINTVKEALKQRIEK